MASFPSFLRDPTKILDPKHLLGLYAVQYLLDIDYSTLLSFVFLLVGIETASQIIFAVFPLSTTVRIEEGDPSYEHIELWMMTKRHYTSSKAFSTEKTSLEDDEKLLKSTTGVDENDEVPDPDRNNPISLKKLWGGFKTIFKPYKTTQFYPYEGNIMLIRHKTKANNKGGKKGVKRAAEKAHYEIKCLGCHNGPIKSFMNAAKLSFYEKKKTTITVYWPSGDMAGWTSLEKPRRPFETVIFDKESLDTFRGDMNEYLHPSTRRWYSDRGLPCCRSYLLSGPRGTGKTSLTLAMATYFALDTYELSLSEQTSMTNSQLMNLVSKLSSPCIVLLKDIDAVARRHPEDPKSSTSNRGKSNDTTLRASSVTLIGLQRAIDAILKRDGFFLVMTAQFLRLLDESLTRSGRVNLHIGTDMPSRNAMRDFFLSIYDISALMPSKRDEEVEKDDEIEGTSALRKLAETFSDSIPAKRLSFASLERFLLQYRQHPKEASEKAREWTQAELQEIAEGEEREAANI